MGPTVVEPQMPFRVEPTPGASRVRGCAGQASGMGSLEEERPHASGQRQQPSCAAKQHGRRGVLRAKRALGAPRGHLPGPPQQWRPPDTSSAMGDAPVIASRARSRRSARAPHPLKTALSLGARRIAPLAPPPQRLPSRAAPRSGPLVILSSQKGRARALGRAARHLQVRSAPPPARPGGNRLPALSGVRAPYQ